MRKIIACLVVLILISCNQHPKSEDFELEITSNKLISNRSNPVKNILTYKLTNNTKTTYYFKQFQLSRMFGNMNIYHYPIGNCEIIIQNSKKDTLRVVSPCIDYTPEYYNFLDSLKKRTKELGYVDHTDAIYYNRNFLIHAGETLYFEELLYLPKDRYYSYPELSEKSNLSILVVSDSTRYKEFVARPMLETIKKNGYKVFHGIIKSKNMIPIQVDK